MKRTGVFSRVRLRSRVAACVSVLLIATGASKADAVAQALEGPLTASCPASVLQLHPHATILVDTAAASALRRIDHYREVYAAKPRWQNL